MKRLDYIDWNTTFIGMAALLSQRSKDPNTRHGAVITDSDNKVISVGYNGFPRGCNDDSFPWSKPEKYDYAVHAEENAIYNATRSMKNSTLYLYSERGYYPCCRCARGMIQVGIKKLIMAFSINSNTDKYDWEPTKKMFKAADVKVIILEYGINMFASLQDKFEKMHDIAKTFN